MSLGARTVSEFEARVVGSILAKGDAIHDLPAKFSSAVITDERLRRAFEGVEKLARRKALPPGPVDQSLVLAEAGLPESSLTLLDEAVYLAGSFDAGTIAESARVLLERHVRGRLQGLLERAAGALNGEKGTDEIVGHLMAQLLDLDGGDRPETVDLGDALLEVVNTAEAIQTGKEKVLRTGFSGIDRVLRIRRGNFVVLAARPKVGKTTLAEQIADNVSSRGEHVLVHSLEMDPAELATLELSRNARIDSMRFFDDEGKFSADEWSRIMAAADKRVPHGTRGFLHINSFHHSLGAILRITEKLHRKHGLALVIVDYLQLIQLSLGKNATRENVVSAISRTLKLTAQRLGVPVLALAQLNRESVKRGDAGKQRQPKQAPNQPPPPPPRSPAPQLHDLRESGSIEQDANAVCFLHNPFADDPDQIRREHGPFEFIVAAQRLGPKGAVPLHADRKFSRFVEVTAKQPPPGPAVSNWQDSEGDDR